MVGQRGGRGACPVPQLVGRSTTAASRNVAWCGSSARSEHTPPAGAGPRWRGRAREGAEAAAARRDARRGLVTSRVRRRRFLKDSGRCIHGVDQKCSRSRHAGIVAARSRAVNGRSSRRRVGIPPVVAAEYWKPSVRNGLHRVGRRRRLSPKGRVGRLARGRGRRRRRRADHHRAHSEGLSRPPVRSRPPSSGAAVLVPLAITSVWLFGGRIRPLSNRN